MDDIKLVRLQSGVDIICEYINVGNTIFIKKPMTVYMDYEDDESNLIMRHWLPIELISIDETVMDAKDVLCICEPTEQLIQFYTNIIEEELEENELDSIDDIIDNNTKLH